MYAAFQAGDVEGALAHHAEDVVIDTTRGRVDGTVGRGREAVATTIASWVGAFEEWHEEIEEVRGVGDSVFVAATQHGIGKESGIEVETRYALVYEVRDGLIARMTMYPSRDEALRAAGAD